MALKHIKLKILSVKKTSTVTRAMEAVSAVKMRKAQERALRARSYARAALRILAHISGIIDIKYHPLFHKDPSNNVTCIVLVTSDKGLAGSLNSALLKKVQTYMREEGDSETKFEFICLGKRGYEFAQRAGHHVHYFHTNIADSVTETDVREVTNRITTMQMNGQIRKVYAAYTNFRSTFEQEPVMRQILPLRREVLRDIVDGIVPEKGKYAELARSAATIGQNAPDSYVIEPNPEEVLNVVLPQLANIAVFHALLEAKASEHSARMVAMKSATDKAKEMARNLTRKFNKVRQAAITREVSEIVGGIEAMK